MILYGKPLANNIYKDLKSKISSLKAKDIIPALAIILVGNNPESVSYVKQKLQKCLKLGIRAQLLKFKDNDTYHELQQKILSLNNNKDVHGIIIQLPLPPHLARKNLPHLVSPRKDVDGFHPQSVFVSPISEAVLALTKEASGFKKQADFISWLKNKNIVVVGKGPTGGEPIINSLKRMKINPKLIDSKTLNPQSVIGRADIIVTAAGKPNLIQGKFIKQGSILVSIGIAKIGTKLYGDYDEEDVSSKAGSYTPTPGGVGPLLVAYLLRNVVAAAQKNSEKL